MKISKRLREQAAELCSIFASDAADWTAEMAGTNVTYDEAVRSMGFSANAKHLACASFDATTEIAVDSNGRWEAEVDWAETEAMLRCGWSPR